MNGLSEDLDHDDVAVAMCRGMAKIASTLAFGHAHCLFAGSWCYQIRASEDCDDLFVEVLHVLKLAFSLYFCGLIFCFLNVPIAVFEYTRSLCIVASI